MPEENERNGNGKIVPPAGENIKELRIVITKNLENGQLGVQAPGNGEMYDQYLCVGLMNDAEDFIKAHNRRAAQSKIIKSNPTMAQQVRGFLKRR